MNNRMLGYIALSVIVAECTFCNLSVRAAEANIPADSLQTIHEKKSTKENKVSKKVAKKLERERRNTEDQALDSLSPALPDDSERVASNEAKKPLQGSATYVDVSSRFGDSVHNLTKTALNNDAEYQKTAKAVDHYRTTFQRTLRTTKDAINYALPYRGFSMSMEGSRVILDKKQKLNNLWVAELAKQKYWDEMHPKVTAQLMQIAMGLGIADPQQSANAVQKGMDGLTNLVGADAAQSTLNELSEWKNQLNVPDSVYQQEPWDPDTANGVYQQALKTSGEGDALIQFVFNRVKKFDHSKLANFTASVIEADLSAITIFSGNPLASVAAEGVSTAFVMSTGGPEENKILKELYYGRRLEIRRKRISDEAQMALSNYEKAILTHNPSQLAMSEIVLAELVGPDKIPDVLARDPINDFTVNAPIELAKKTVTD